MLHPNAPCTYPIIIFKPFNISGFDWVEYMVNMNNNPKFSMIFELFDRVFECLPNLSKVGHLDIFSSDRTTMGSLQEDSFAAGTFLIFGKSF